MLNLVSLYCFDDFRRAVKGNLPLFWEAFASAAEVLLITVF